ncbi:MAG: hypothetical protein ACI4LK_09000 [Lentihominibacter sp.]
MAVTYFPFNSIVVDGVPDRPANAENLAAYLAGFFSPGVLMQQDTSLQVSVSSGMNVQIHAGVGNINGKTILNTAAEIVPIEAASLTLDRIDRVIFRLDEVNRLMEFDVLKGTAASSPTAPALTQGADIYEMCLAEVRVPAGASEIIASYITDKRADSTLCGYSSIPAHMHDLSKLGIADYVIEEGASTETNSYYRKRASGIAEYWHRFNPGSMTIGTARGSFYTGNYFKTSFHSGLFTDVPQVEHSVYLATSAYVIGTQVNSVTKDAVELRVWASGSIAATNGYMISIYAVGKWK